MNDPSPDHAGGAAIACLLNEDLLTEMLTMIASSVDSITQATMQIATAAEEQSHVAEDINQNVTNIKQMGEENAAEVAHTTAAAQDLSGNVDGLVALVSRFRMRG